ncbi:MAG: cyclopropane-fatty-acyl-phospholipid synthase family protein [Gammaproteobacteria bacterium]|jgi:cyclopropane-fatty-acyl-phospholipid synthase
MLRRHVIKKFLKTFNHVESGHITLTMPDGKVYSFKGKNEGPTADLVIYNLNAIHQFATKGDIGFAESYREKYWDSNDLISLFKFGLTNESTFQKYIHGGILGRFISRLGNFLNHNSVRGSKKNILAHYDLGNEFYELWLDPTMTYSSAIFENENDTLISAQCRKYDRIIENLNDSGNLLEIGCGWGGFVERALTKRDYSVKAITISDAQYSYAKNRLKDSVIVCSEDYRAQEGKYNQIVSIEMFEAVGEKLWDTYFRKIKNLLAEKGKACVQTIMINECHFERYRRSGDAIRRFIFPGGMLPSLERFTAASAKAGLVVTDRFAFGQDYALTMKHWLMAFDDKFEQVKKMGFDEKFIRIWRFYLTSCIASFQMGRINVMQIALEHAR